MKTILEFSWGDEIAVTVNDFGGAVLSNTMKQTMGQQPLAITAGVDMLESLLLALAAKGLDLSQYKDEIESVLTGFYDRYA